MYHYRDGRVGSHRESCTSVDNNILTHCSQDGNTITDSEPLTEHIGVDMFPEWTEKARDMSQRSRKLKAQTSKDQDRKMDFMAAIHKLKEMSTRLEEEIREEEHFKSQLDIQTKANEILQARITDLEALLSEKQSMHTSDHGLDVV